MINRRRSKKENLDPFGFSFLAVLSCVLGVVVFLLVYLTSFTEANSYFIESMAISLTDKIPTVNDEKRNIGIENRELVESRKKKEKDYEEFKDKLNKVFVRSSELQNEINKLENEGPIIRLVPYEGKTGRKKFPVYIECKEYTIVIYPEKAVINEINIDKDNYYIKELLKKLKRNTDKQYAIFLIHPAGFKTYYNINEIISAIDINVGYEPVDADWKLQL